MPRLVKLSVWVEELEVQLRDRSSPVLSHREAYREAAAERTLAVVAASSR